MKKKLTMLFSSLALVLVMIATLCACSTYGSVKRAYEKEGWSENENISTSQEKMVTDVLGEDYKDTCKIHVIQKDDSLLGLNFVIILEFNSTKEMDEEIKDNATLKGMIQDAQKSDRVSGTCILLFFTPAGGGDTIFKSTKK